MKNLLLLTLLVLPGLPAVAQSFEVASLSPQTAPATPTSVSASAEVTPPDIPASVPAPVAAIPTSTPRFFGAGATGDTSTTPNFTGWAGYATQISSAQRLYSYSVLQFSRGATGTIQTTAGTGVALYVRTVWKFDIYANATGGVVTTGTATSMGFSGGAIGIAHFTPTSPWAVIIGYNVLKSPVASANTIQVGIGYESK